MLTMPYGSGYVNLKVATWNMAYWSARVAAWEPYVTPQRALKAEIDGAAWASLCSTRSRPLDLPAIGKIAVKVINHYGDEVLKVHAVHSESDR